MLSLIIMNYLINGKCLFFYMDRYVFVYIQSRVKFCMIKL